MELLSRVLFALLLLVSPLHAADQPWVAQGQTAVARDSNIFNPVSNTSDVDGLINLPYTVPSCKRLQLTLITLEPLWGAAIIPFTGITGLLDAHTNSLDTYTSGGKPNGPTNAMSVGGNIGFNSPSIGGGVYNGQIIKTESDLLPTKVWPVEYWLSAGKTINMRLSAGWNDNPGWVYGWSMKGRLHDAPC